MFKAITPISVARSLRWQCCRAFSSSVNETFLSSLCATEWSNSRPFSEIPRPSSYEIIRGFLPGGKFYDKSVAEFGLKMREKYGDIYLLPGLFGRQNIVMCFDLNDIEKITRNEGQWPQRHVLDTLVHHRTEIKGDYFQDTVGLVVSQGENWFRHRTAVNPVMMQPKMTKMYFKPVMRTTSEFIQRISEIRDPITFEAPANFEEDINRFNFETICAVGLNKELGLIRRSRDNPEAMRFFENLRTLFYLAFKMDIQPSMWKTIRTPKYYRMIKVLDEIFDTTYKYVLEALERKKNDQTDGELSVLDKLVAIDKKIAIVMAMDMLIAGVDTTSSTFVGILLSIAKSPDKQAILRKEVLSILPEKDSDLTMDGLKNMPYLRACIKEGMRLYPIGPGHLRTTLGDLTLGGYQLPKGTIVLMNTNVLASEEKYFPQAKEFIPERWLRSSENNNLGVQIQPFTFIPFGFGPRMCVGRRIVELELEVVISKIIRNFYLEFNYSTEKAFRSSFINVPAIPLKFKFADVEY